MNENEPIQEPIIEPTNGSVQEQKNQPIQASVVNQETPPATNPPQQQVIHSKKRLKIVGLAASFVAVAVVFSSLTGYLVYSKVKGLLQTAQTEISDQSAGSTDNSETTTAGNTVAKNNLTDKFFSIESAAAKTAAGKTTLSISEIAAQGKPAVVAINTEISVSTPFGENGTVPAAGSGFIITADGYIVTNHHVIDGAQKISVTLDSGKVYDATLVGSDSINDLAVLKIDGQDLPTVTLGSSADLEVGELAVAIGNPLGELSGTVTAGIISALDRSISIDGQTMYLLQTDAAINAGNSGGALFNSFGEVIGINTAKNAGTGIEGLGFAIPIDHAKPIIENLIQTGSTITPPQIGISIQDITAEMATQYNLPVGVYVAIVQDGSPAQKAGLQQGDVIIAVNGQETLTTESINAIKNKLAVGDTLTLTVVRQSKNIDIKVVLGSGQS
jgi:serine protease Do